MASQSTATYPLRQKGLRLQAPVDGRRRVGARVVADSETAPVQFHGDVVVVPLVQQHPTVLVRGNLTTQRGVCMSSTQSAASMNAAAKADTHCGLRGEREMPSIHEKYDLISAAGTCVLQTARAQTGFACGVVAAKNQRREGKRHLQANVGLGREEVRGQLQVRLAAHKVHGNQRVAALALVAVQTLAAGVRPGHHALRPVQALVVVARAGAREDHGRRELAEQPAGRHGSAV